MKWRRMYWVQENNETINQTEYEHHSEINTSRILWILRREEVTDGGGRYVM